MNTIIFAFLFMLVCVSAFQSMKPHGVAARANVMTMSDKMVGKSVEMGNQIFDPMDFLKLHAISPSTFPHAQWLREAELKHCRIAMLATVGAFLPSSMGLVIPGYTANIDPVTNFNQFVVDFPFGFTQIMLSIALIEGTTFNGDAWFGTSTRESGAIGYDPLGQFKNKTPAQQDVIRLQELKNGRLAMIAMAGLFAEHWVPGALPFTLGHY